MTRVLILKSWSTRVTSLLNRAVAIKGGLLLGVAGTLCGLCQQCLSDRSLRPVPRMQQARSSGTIKR